MLPIDQGFSLGTKRRTGGVTSRCRGVSLTTVKPCLVWYFSYLIFPVFRGFFLRVRESPSHQKYFCLAHQMDNGNTSLLNHPYTIPQVSAERSITKDTTGCQYFTRCLYFTGYRIALTGTGTSRLQKQKFRC